MAKPRMLITSALAGSLALGSIATAQSVVAADNAPVSAESGKAVEKAARAEAAAERKRLAELKRKYGAGPYPHEIEAYLGDKPEPLRPLYRTLFTGGERNAVLNFERLGLAAMDLGFWSNAEAAFDGALLRIEAIYAKNKQAEAARSVFRKESNKDFKGEPYERAMAYYYRGLLYLRSGDYDNARASFKTAEYQDTVSEAEEFQSDFAVMNYLIGWTQHCQGAQGSAAEAFAAATKAQPGLLPPAATHDVLLIAELGRGPVKARGEAEAQKLVFNPADGAAENGARFELDSATMVTAKPASSVYFQATTRGGRAIDGILDGKASFKDTTGAIGQIATQIGMTQMLGGESSGSAFAAAGMLFSILSSAAKIDADIRSWDSLPDTIVLGTAVRPASQLEPRVTYWSNDRQIGDAVAPVLAAGDPKCAVVWSRSRGSGNLSADVPGDDSGVAKSLARKKAIQAKDAQFRTALASYAGASR